MENRNYSIITNFGCHWTCPYCIVRNNDLEIAKTKMDVVLDTVKKLIKENKIDFLSFSGGGDPLFMMNKERIEWYEEILNLCRVNGIETEMHTSFLNNKLTKKLKFDRIVYHCLHAEQVDLLKQNHNEVVRAVFVVQEHFSKEYINSIVERVEKSEVVSELSFRQRMDENYQETFTEHDYLLAGHKGKWHYICQDDYNNYIVNDRISHKYEEFKQ